MDKVILQLININKSFATVKVLKDIDLELKKGQILGLVGENGAGKSTLMNILGGIYPMTSGEMYLNGVRYSPSNPKDATNSGIAFIHQELNLFTNLTVAENIFIDEIKFNKFGYISYQKLNQEASLILKRLGLDISPGIVVENLPMGMRQMVEIAKALSKDAKIVIFDEPTTSLSSQEKKNLFRIIRELSEDGISMIYISHVLDDVLLLCNEIVVIRDGEVIGKQMPKSEVSKEKIISMMVGREMGQLYPYVPKEIGEEILSVENINQGKTLKNITFSIRSGEIVGLFGLMGAGRSELVRAIYGLDPIDSGSIKFMNKPVHSLNPRQWIQNGMAFITENRHEEGLLMKKSVKENLVMANLERMRLRFGYLDRKKEEVDSTNVISRLNIKTYDKDHQIVRFLSGGNQQKVVIGKWLLTTPKVFIIDEPTRGVDVGAKFEIYNHINSLVKEGSAVLFVSSEMEELMGVCDRILTMHLGRITGEVERKDFSQETLIRLAMGGVGQ